jgi:hypothetical protein
MNIGHRTRRRLLRELATVAALWPAARMLHSDLAAAQSTPPRRRYLQVFLPHGMSRPHWVPRTSSSGGLALDFTDAGEPSTLGPLQPFADQLVVIDGLDMACGYAAGRQGHEQGTAGVFTGAAAASNDGLLSNGPSLDRLIYDHLISQGVSMPAGIQDFGVASYSMSFHTQSGGVWQQASDPRESEGRFALFDGVGSGSAGPDPIVERRKARRRAALDYARDRVRALQGDLGTFEQQKLEQHLDSLASVRRRYEASSATVATCSAPSAPDPYPTFWDSADTVQLAAVQSTLIAQLFACDLTRVAAWTLGDSFSNVVPHWLGVDLASHDTLIHGNNVATGGTSFRGPVWDDSGLTRNCPPARAGYLALQRWYHQALADLFSAMNQIREPDGRTVLQNTTVLALSDMGNPANHWNTGLPCFVTSGGSFAGDRLLRLAGIDTPGPFAQMQAHNAVLVSVARSFGMNVDSVGDARFTGALPGL